MNDEAAWRVLSSQLVLDRSPWLRVIEESVALPSGVQIHGYLLTPARDYAMTVAITSTGGVLMVKQYKHGIRRAVLEFPAGYIDESDASPLACAQRELSEETGHESESWTSLGSFAVDPNRGQTLAHFFLAKSAVLVKSQHLDKTEALTVASVAVQDVPAALLGSSGGVLACTAAWALASPHLE